MHVALYKRTTFAYIMLISFYESLIFIDMKWAKNITPPTPALQQVMGPRIVEHPKNTYVVRDDLPVLNCSVESNPPAVITWYKWVSSCHDDNYITTTTMMTM